MPQWGLVEEGLWQAGRMGRPPWGRQPSPLEPTSSGVSTSTCIPAPSLSFPLDSWRPFSTSPLPVRVQPQVYKQQGDFQKGPGRLSVSNYNNYSCTLTPTRPTSLGFCPPEPTLPLLWFIPLPPPPPHTRGFCFVRSLMSTQPSPWQQQLPTPNTRAGIYRGECISPGNKHTGEVLWGGGGGVPEETWVSDGGGRLEVMSPNHFPPTSCSKPPAEKPQIGLVHPFTGLLLRTRHWMTPEDISASPWILAVSPYLHLALFRSLLGLTL